jgi:hypothetical protein
MEFAFPIAAIGIVIIFVAINLYQSIRNTLQPIKIIQQHEQIAESKYIISEEMVMSKLRSKSQIVSLQQSIDKKNTYVDDSLLGERQTELTVHGIYKFGLNTKDIEIKHIDNENGIIFLHIGKPALISLDIPYDHVTFDKTKGWLRLSMDEKEEKQFYKAVEKNIEQELMKDRELQKQADLHNKDVVMRILKLIPEIKSVIFE